MDNRPDRLTSRDYGRLLEPVLEQAAGYALSILRRRADAEDAVQQAALRGLERLATYEPARPFKGWWFAVLRHVCIDLMRSRRHHVDLGAAENLVRETKGDWCELAEALGQLEAGQAEILRLRYFAGLTYDELAVALAIPKGTVMSRLHYAKQALSEVFMGENT